MDKNKKLTVRTVVGAVIFVLLLAVLVFVVMRGVAANRSLGETAEEPAATAAPTPTPTPEPTPTPVGLADFKPHSVDGTEPERLISSTAIMVDGEIVEDYESDYGEIYRARGCHNLPRRQLPHGCSLRHGRCYE